VWVFWALLFLAGVRFGEASARRWRDYQRDHMPLRKHIVNTSWHSQRKIEKSIKTKVARDVPVDPVLAEILDEYQERGWERVMGRRPTEEDLIAPFGEPDEVVRCCAKKRRQFFGEHCDDQMMLKRFHKDLALLGDPQLAPGARRADRRGGERCDVSVVRAGRCYTLRRHFRICCSDPAVFDSMLDGARRGTRTPTSFETRT
jgi:integrase